MERAEILREKGTNRSRFFRGQVDKYTWVDLGSSYLMSDLLAAFLAGSWSSSTDAGAAAADVGGVRRELARLGGEQRRVGTPFVPAHCEQAYHMYYLMMPSLDAARADRHLKQGDPDRLSLPAAASVGDGRTFGGHAGQCPS